MVDLKNVMDDNEIVLYWKTRTDNIDKIKPILDPETISRRDYLEKMRRMKRLRDQAQMLRELPASSGKARAIVINTQKTLSLKRDVRSARILQLGKWLDSGLMSDLDYYKEMENV